MFTSAWQLGHFIKVTHESQGLSWYKWLTEPDRAPKLTKVPSKLSDSLSQANSFFYLASSPQEQHQDETHSACTAYEEQ